MTHSAGTRNFFHKQRARYFVIQPYRPRNILNHGPREAEEEEPVLPAQNPAKAQKHSTDHHSSRDCQGMACSPPSRLYSRALTTFPRNHKETASRNYARLGLTSKLNQLSGGTEKDKSAQSYGSSHSNLNIKSQLPTNLLPSEARVERDSRTGKILRVVDQDQFQKLNPLNDPLNDIDEMESETEDALEPNTTIGKTPLVHQLERRASRGERKSTRKQSSRETTWVEALVKKYGDDYSKMVWDKELNPMQQSAGDIKRRVQRWRDNQV